MPQRTTDEKAPKPLWIYKGYLLIAAAIWGHGGPSLSRRRSIRFPRHGSSASALPSRGFYLPSCSFPGLKKSLNADHLKKGGILGAFVFLSYWTNSTGLTDTTASNSAFLTSLYCVIIPFLMWVLSGPKPTRFNIAAALVCVAGVGCVSFAGSTDFSIRFGDAITLLSAVFRVSMLCTRRNSQTAAT